MGQAWHSRGGLNDLPPGERIALVVEPDPAKRAEATMILRSMGYKTYDTGCGAVGQFIASQLLLEVAIVDAELPDLDGLQVLRRLRTRLPDAVIIATAAPDARWEETAAEALDAGADFALSSLSAATLRAVLAGGRPDRDGYETRPSE